MTASDLTLAQGEFNGQRGEMKLRLLSIAAVAAAAIVAAVTAGTAGAAATCTPTGFVRDSINLTAALINPGKVTGTVDATGCNIGVYYGPGSKGQVNKAEIFGSNYYGVVNNGGNVEVQNSYVHDIGEVPFNGTQHGVGIYWAFGSGATGDIHNNTVSRYQKGGIVVNSGSSDIHNNTVTGLGPVDFIAQNGIQVGYGANASVHNNVVTGNSYTGPNGASSGGILVVGGDCYGGPLTVGTPINNNTLDGNDVGVFISNLDASCNPPSTPTKLDVHNNAISNTAVNNTSGDGPGAGYQAGISDSGNGDSIHNNSICGAGYTPVSPPPYLFFIDVTFTNNAALKNNSTSSSCS